MTSALTTALSAQARRVTPPQDVASLADLNPKTPDQVRRAILLLDDPYLRLLPDREPLLRTRSVDITWFDPYRTAGPPRLSPAESLAASACSSPVIVVGEARSAETFFLSDHTGLFTDFRVAVDRWIRPASAGNEILVSMVGGRARAAGQTSLSFRVNYFMETRQKYLMFLEWSDVAKAYLVKRQPQPIAGGKVIVSFDPRMTLEDEDSFLKQVSSAAALCRQ